MRERVGRYQLLDRIGAGGMGVVWRAVDDEGRHVALKTLRAHDAEMRRALLREIAGLARLRHPGIAGFVDHGEHEGHPFYAMTWIDGAPLDLRGGTAVTVAYDDTWDRATPAIAEQPDLQTVLTVFHRLCGTLAWLHGEGIVHRDLKPDNVLVGLDGWPVLVDFGLAGRFAGGRSREAAADGIVRAGTPGLIAPEQRRGALVDARADLYSLGCMLYLGLTGALPPDPYQTVPRPSDAAREVPPALDDVVARLLARRPEDRPGHAEDVACVLAELGADPTPWPSAPPARPWVYRPRLAGRDAELDAIDRVVAEARGVLLLHGPAGAGRSRLVLEAAARAWAARRRPIVVATGGAELTSALGTLVERLEADDVVDRLDPVVGRMFPALERHLGPAGREPTLERVVSATLALLALLAEAKPLVLAIDDLDAADELTVALVTRIHREEPARIGVVASVRDPSGLPVELAGGARVLGELDGIAVAAMVRDMLAVPEVDEASAARLAERTRGRPLLVVEALRTGVHLGLLTRRGGRWRLSRPIEELLPREERGDVATALFLQRVAQVAPEARELLSVAAVAGEAVDLDLLCELLPGTPVDAVAAELVRGGLLDADGPVVRFVHSSLREALARAVPEPRRTELHGRIADRLSDPGMRAEHLARAGRVSEAVTACREAATAARRRGLVLTEVEALTAATALAGSVAPDLAYDLVKAEVAAGRMDDAARHAREALDGLAPESPWRVQLMQALAFAQLRVGRVEALDIAREAVRLARASGVQVSSALATLGFVAWSRGELEEARAALDEALGVESDPQRLAGILLNLSGLLAMERKRTEATACLHRALGLRPHEHHLGPLYTNLAAMQVWGGELEAARRSLASAEEADAACGDLYGTLSTHLLEARVESLAGRPAVADAIVGHTLSRARALRMPVLVREALLLSAELRLDEDDVEAAGRALEEVLEDPVESLVGASLLESRRRRRLGDLAGARRALDAAGPVDALLGDSRPLAAMEAVHLARAEGRDGAVELDHLHRILASFPDPIHPDSVVGRALAALDS